MKKLLQKGMSFILTLGLIAISLLSSETVVADVVVTPATGGTNISADNAANATSPLYISIGDIVVTESLATDIAAGTAQTLILTAPAGWRFNTGTGTVNTGVSVDVSNASIVVNASTITITFDVSGNAGIDEISISGIQVQSLNGAVLPGAGQVYQSIASPGTAAIASLTSTSNTDGSGGTNFGSLSQVEGVVAQLAFTTQPGSATVGSIFGQQPVVVSQDQFGTPSTNGLGVTQNVIISLSAGTGSLTGTNSLNIGTGGGNGTVNFTDLQIDAAGVKKLAANSAPLTSSETNSFTVAAANSSTVLTSDINPSCISTSVTLTATVSPATATGTVEFFDGASSLGTAAIVSGVASLAVSSLPAGIRSLTAVYSGDANYTTSTSTAYNQTVNAASADPISATALPATICNGQSSILTLNGGGGGTGAIINWYTSSCGGTLVGTGNNLSVSPIITTTYYGRYEDPAPCNLNTACMTVTVTVNQKSGDPTSATATEAIVCKGSSTQLILAGGGSGNAETIHWYSGSCGGTSVGTGNNLTVTPSGTTTYFGRYENAAPCNYNSLCAQVTVTVNDKSTVAPTSITAAPATICNGQSTTLTKVGGVAGTGAVVTWYAGGCGTGGAIGTGNSITVSPTSTTTYYVRFEDPAPCSSNTTCASVTVTVNQKSSDPTGATATPATICNGGSSTLALTGGGGGTGQTIKWYTGSCGGTPVTGSVVSPTTTTIYYGRYENPAPCSFNTTCQTVTVTVNQKSTNPTSVTASQTTICNGGTTTLTLNGGGGGTSPTVGWYSGSCGGTFIGSGNPITVGPSTTTTYYGRYENGAPCNFNTACASVTITVSNPVANAGGNQNICGGSTVIGGSPAGSGTAPLTYSWSPATGLSSTSVANPTATPPSFPFTYTLTVSDGCGNTSAPSSTTISTGGVVKNWVGTGALAATGPNNNFNNPLNWNPGGVPGSCNDVTITLVSGTSVLINSSVTINSLTYTGNLGTSTLDVQGNTLTINNNTTVAANLGQVQIGVNNGAAGLIDFKGNVSLGTGAGISSFVGNNNSRIIFRKNVTMGTLAYVGTAPGSIEFLGTGTQNFAWNSNITAILTARFRNVIIGDATNNPTVTITGSQKADNILGNLTVNGSSVLDLGTNQWNRNSATGTFQLNGTSTLRLAAASSAQTGIIFINQGGVVVAGSNMPGGFTYVFSPTSTVEYYGAVAQTVYATPVYGNLTITNAAQKTAGNSLTIAGNVLINPNGSFRANTATNWTHTVAGNWTNNGSFSYLAGTVNTVSFVGGTSATISGSATTGFHSMTVNKGTSIATTLDVLSTVTTAASPATLSFTNGLLRIQPSGNFTHNGAGPTISSTAGLHVNGGVFVNGNSTITNAGLFRVSSGTATLGLIAGNSLDNNAGGVFDMTGGTVSITGRLTFSTGATAVSNISGGTINLSTVGNGSGTATLDMTAASKINVSAGIINFKTANSVGNDVNLPAGGAKLFTGGTMQFGMAGTAGGQIFKINSQVSIYNLTVFNVGAPTARLLNNLVGSNDITIKATATLDGATNNKDIFTAGNWVNDGSYLPGATTTFNGLAAQSISGATANTNFNNLTNSNTSDTLTINSNITVAKEMALNIGARLKLATGNVTLRSDALGTANVGKISDVDAIKYSGGQFIVERYIPNHSKAWQFLAIPARGTGQTINQAWQEGNGPLGNSKPGYGTILTSNLPNAVTSRGFDIYTQPGPSMKVYDTITDGWIGVDNTSLAIEYKKGYMVFVRGARNVIAYNQPANATTLRTTGRLHTPGTDAPPSTSVIASNFESIGNPYASAIDFALVTKTGGVQTDFFYLWDPKLTTGPYSPYGLGGYQTFSWNGSGFDVTPGGGSYAGTNHFIESGQAFFVHAPSTSGTVSFTEACKVSGSNNVNRLPLSTLKQLRTNLSVITPVEKVLIDGNLVQFDQSFSNAVDIHDAVKLNNTGENVGLKRNGKILAIEKRHSVRVTDTIFLNMGQLRTQQYEFDFNASGLERNGLVAYLEDSYLHNSTELSLNGNTNVPFNVSSDPNSYAANRFRIVFKQRRHPLIATAEITAIRNSDKSISVRWNAEEDADVALYIIERSADASNFTSIKATEPMAKNAAASYIINDLDPLPVDNYYRLKLLSADGKTAYSKVVKVAPITSLRSMEVYPNPVTGQQLQVMFSGYATGIYKLTLIDGRGQQHKLSNIQVQVDNTVFSIKLPSMLAAGIYRIEAIGPANDVTTRSIYINR